jgi:nucleotide-binding universal stress UspA family protein
MVGTDRSQTAERAVQWAADFAQRFGAELHIVQVVVPAHPTDTEYGAAEVTRARARPTSCSCTPRASLASAGSLTS